LCQKLAFDLIKVSVSDNWPNIICQVLLLIGIKEQFVISDNAHSLHRGDYLAYDLCPSCLMLVQPQEFSVPMKNKDILIFCITQVFKNNDIQHRVQFTQLLSSLVAKQLTRNSGAKIKN